MRFCASLLSMMTLGLVGCGQEDTVGHGFTIENVVISSAYQSINVHLQQTLELSEHAREALEHGVTLVVELDLELRNDDNLIVVRRDATHFQLRYLPLSERYQLSEEETDELRTFSRLRHLLAAIDDLDVHLSTGPLPPGGYELRTRIRLDESRLPAPMRLPAWLSAQWQHDSEWSVWPFKISV